MNKINQRHALSLQSIFKQHGEGFLAKHKLCSQQLKAVQAIQQCRTHALGGHIAQCQQCNHQKISYNSCRNRNCNQCQYTKQLQWVDQLQSKLPVCGYFHIVFTIPQALHKVFYLNQKICYTLLFQSAWQALNKLALNPKFLGAQTGAVTVLHTWGEALTYHPHIHMLVPAGGLSADQTEWINSGKKFIVPVKALSKVFRGVLWSQLENQLKKQQLKLSDDWKSSAELKAKLSAKPWHIYAKKPLAIIDLPSLKMEK